ncbi:polar amino acid transport system substrate-binding protein [Paenarthrobacter nitroguajacolicus]|uniref:ABC transporter substrate-binding protein n=1 Tax=Paenarthrobacter nitroguajacolicus TaxID=211146 RepID=UPI00285FF57B|nr:ABC transporter substrate-binding protein [Paenarthrobacter nitroguajacolicus]MDR6989743.1 polar amino acid transport system substrate-binding protein [Paenarthrobacter nitroguajacolicus]
MKATTQPRHALKKPMAAASALLSVALLSACGNGAAAPAATSEAKANAEVQALLPEELKKGGTVEIAVDSAYPPMDFMEGDKMVGIEPEIWTAAGELMGVTIKPTTVAFDAIVPALQSQRYQASFAGFWITEERTKAVDMVSFFQSGSQYLVRGDDNKGAIDSFADLCGRSVALQSGSYEMTYAEDAGKECENAGKPAVQIQGYKTQDQATLAVTSGRADATGMGAEVAGYVAQQSKGKLKTAGQVFHTVEGGIALPKGSKLSAAFQAAFNKLIADGKYNEIFAKWGLDSAKIAESKAHTS